MTKDYLIITAGVIALSVMFFDVAIPDLPPVDLPCFEHLDCSKPAALPIDFDAKWVEVSK